jgi:hypothetical protein
MMTTILGWTVFVSPWVALVWAIARSPEYQLRRKGSEHGKDE